MSYASSAGGFRRRGLYHAASRLRSVRHHNFLAPQRPTVYRSGIDNRIGRLTIPPSGDRTISPDDTIDWAVRFGVAYDVTGDSRTLVRRAYGVVYGRPSRSPGVGLPALTLVQPDIRGVYVHRFFVGLQQRVASNFIVRNGLGSEGRKPLTTGVVTRQFTIPIGNGRPARICRMSRTAAIRAPPATTPSRSGNARHSTPGATLL